MSDAVSVPRPPVEPELHPMGDLEEAVLSGNHDSLVVRETIGALAKMGMWQEVWLIADSMSREVSILFDRKQRIYVDVGTSGKVRLAPPLGSEVPYRLWVHTHPSDAYWSSTDLDALATYSGIIQEALVLGSDHLKRAIATESAEARALASEGPLSNWTSEPTVLYSEWGDGAVE